MDNDIIVNGNNDNANTNDSNASGGIGARGFFRGGVRSGASERLNSGQKTTTWLVLFANIIQCTILLHNV